MQSALRCVGITTDALSTLAKALMMMEEKRDLLSVDRYVVSLTGASVLQIHRAAAENGPVV